MKKASLHPLLLATIIFSAFVYGLFLGRLGPFRSNTLSDTTLAAVQQHQQNTGEITNAFVNGKLNINAATAEDLTLLPGIGDTLADRIISYRENNGPFTAVEDLLNVKGIGSASFSKFAEYITVGG